MRSVAPSSEAVSMAHSFGHGTSTAFALWEMEASDSVTPSFTNDAAALHFAGVIRLTVASSSAFDHHAGVVSSVCQRSYSACVTRRDSRSPSRPPCDQTVALAATNTTSTEALTTGSRMG